MLQLNNLESPTILHAPPTQLFTTLLGEQLYLAHHNLDPYTHLKSPRSPRPPSLSPPLYPPTHHHHNSPQPWSQHHSLRHSNHRYLNPTLAHICGLVPLTSNTVDDNIPLSGLLPTPLCQNIKNKLKAATSILHLQHSIPTQYKRKDIKFFLSKNTLPPPLRASLHSLATSHPFRPTSSPTQIGRAHV